MEAKQPVQVKVVDVSEKSYFAAKLGRRVTPIITVEFEGTRYQMTLATHHTNVAGRKKSPQIGDMIKVRLPR